MLKTKDQLRSFYKNQIKQIDDLTILEKKILKNLSQLNIWNSDRVIAAYQSLPNEVSLKNFYKSQFKNQFVFPCIEEDHLEFYKAKDSHSFRKSAQSFLEPIPEKSEHMPIEKIDVFLIPGLAFDRQAGRLGRGSAYYDKALSRSSALKIGLAFSQQIDKTSLPLEDHDVLMDMLVTDQFVLIFGNKFSKFNDISQRTVSYG